MTLPLSHLLHRLRRLAVGPDRTPDADLLARFARTRDEDAFAALMARHGPMVLNACRRVLGDAHRAEDAFQATFLVLARKAGALRRPEALAGWLYGVASRVARKARGREAGQERPRPPENLPDPPDPRPDPLAELSARDLLAVLEEELWRLPEVYRLAVVLCCLEGLSQEEAARRLGWTAGSVKGRLERGRRRLAQRLERRGLTLSAALGVAAWRDVASAGLPAALAERTVPAAVAFAAGSGVIARGVSSEVVALVGGGLQAMSLSGLKVVLGVLLVAGVAGTGLAWLNNGPGKPLPSALASAVAADPGPRPGGAEKEVPDRPALLKKAQADLDELAAAADIADQKLTDRVIEDRQRLAELEERLNEVEGETSRARSARVEEDRLRATEAQLQGDIARTVAIRAEGAPETLRKQLDQVRDQLARIERDRRVEQEARYVKRMDLRRQMVRLEEGIRLLERKRAAQRQEVERRRETLAERIRQLEGGAVPTVRDRGLGAVERRLEAVQDELTELRREIRRLRPERKP
jgi:RNA polymerase sigma factor (sigma-70 family)